MAGKGRLTMKTRFGAAIAIGLAALAVGWWLAAPQRISADSLPPRQADIANGQLVFNAGGCSSCHATPSRDTSEAERTRLGGGLPLETPFGVFHVPNISQDIEDGIGNWSEADFMTAVMRGTSPAGSHYFPSFPYTAYARAKPDDLRDLYAFLKTLPPVPGRAPDHQLSFPFNIRAMVGLWKLMFLDTTPVRSDPSRSPVWNRGAYLVGGLGHCAECHSPRNGLGGIVAAQRFAGGPDPEGKSFVPNITQKGLADWSENDIAYFLETGQTPDGDSVGGSMTRVVRNLALLPAADRAAIATFIKSLPPVDGPKRPKKPE
ncbi:MAG: putative diheme cytochrome c-553 [Tardiphaga sp.]|nr:putative diheme cytochrome c-553 [Tardiphaga sp.]